MTRSLKALSPSSESAENEFIDILINDWRREAPEFDVEAMAVVGRILRLSNLLMRRANDLFREHDLSYSEFDILATLRRTGGDCALKPTELSRAVLLTSGAVTAALDRLEKRGLIERCFDKADRRSVRAMLTRPGKELAQDLAEKRFQDAQDCISSLNAQERKLMSDALRKMSVDLGRQGSD